MKKTFFNLSILLCLSLVFVLKTLTVSAAKETGPYPSRRGVILVTSDKYKNLIPTGHAAIVWDKNNVIESVSKGDVLGKNNWKATKSRIYGVTVKSTNTGQDRKAALWCKKQIHKKYNFNYYNVATRKRFYCSQLVWASYKDNFQIDLNTTSYGKAVHPMELVNSNKTVILYTYSR